MPRAKSAIEKVLEAWKSLQPAEKAAVMALIKMDTEPPKVKKTSKKVEKPQPLAAVPQ